MAFFSFATFAESPAEQTASPTEQAASQQKSQDQSGEFAVSFVRDKNYACTQCHKDDHDALKGEHAKAMNEKTGRNVGCVDCHSTISPEHRNGAPHVVKFKQGQAVAGKEKPAQDAAWISKQNAQCLDCHEGKQLREANWTHDVHAQSLTCASCHKIHPEKDPMQDIERKPRIKMCVDCHSDMTETKYQNKQQNMPHDHQSAIKQEGE
ncbi:MAG: cytochrome c nitrite reductase pentaheme subunit [Vibrio sp.]